MKKEFRRFSALMIAALMICICSVGCGNISENANSTEGSSQEAASSRAVAKAGEDEEWEDIFESWNEEAPALQTLIDYVETVTDESSKDFIPVERRIAVFDMDGTIYGELFPTYFEYYLFCRRVLADPNFKADDDMIAVAEEIREGGPTHTYASDMTIRHAQQAARAYAGMTLVEFADYVTETLLQDADGFTGMTYGEAFYQPMVEVIDYLTENDFNVYVVSGSDRYLCRTLFEGTVDIPDENFIGMDVALEASGQGDTDGLDYNFAASDQLLRTDQLQVKNLKTNKVTAIAREIGLQPVLSFGNSSGDCSMHMYTISNNPYKSEAFMLIADDDQRDYGHPEKGEELRNEWEGDGFNVISMRDDFKTIYGENVKKTGSFHWTEELSGKKDK